MAQKDLRFIDKSLLHFSLKVNRLSDLKQSIQVAITLFKHSETTDNREHQLH